MIKEVKITKQKKNLGQWYDVVEECKNQQAMLNIDLNSTSGESKTVEEEATKNKEEIKNKFMSKLRRGKNRKQGLLILKLRNAIEYNANTKSMWLDSDQNPRWVTTDIALDYLKMNEIKKLSTPTKAKATNLVVLDKKVRRGIYEKVIAVRLNEEALEIFEQVNTIMGGD
jgi:hypothetical protein